jgi:hypothetical protein
MTAGYLLIRCFSLFHRSLFRDRNKCINFAFHRVDAIQNRAG